MEHHPPKTICNYYGQPDRQNFGVW